MTCVVCKRSIHFWQKNGFNSSWHKSCSAAFDMGYNAARNFSESELYIIGIDSPWKFYAERMHGYCGVFVPSAQEAAEQLFEKGILK